MPVIPEHIATKELRELLAEEQAQDSEELLEIWAEAGTVDDESFPSSEHLATVWKQIESRLEAGKVEDRVPTGRSSTKRIFLRYALPVAAVIVIVAVGISLQISPSRYAALPGERISIALPDGSTADLNGGSQLTFHRKLNGKSVVKLQGEAFFDVPAHEAGFKVETFNALIEVVGTSFNVRAWRNDIESRTTVALESGKLLLSHKLHNADAVLMSPGQARSIVASNSIPSPADSSGFTQRLAWRKGDLIFREILLPDALREIERRFGLEIELSASSFRQRRINVAFRLPDNAELVINDLAQALGLYYRRTGSGFEIYSLNN